MTEITDEGRKLAAELANAAVVPGNIYEASFDEGHFVGDCGFPFRVALARLATDYLALQKSLEAAAWGEREAEQALAALKAEHENAVADLREIDRRIKEYREKLHMDAGLVVLAVQPIAAKYRETDPLVEAIEAAWGPDLSGDNYSRSSASLRAELSKRGYELARVKP